MGYPQIWWLIMIFCIEMIKRWIVHHPNPKAGLKKGPLLYTQTINSTQKSIKFQWIRHFSWAILISLPLNSHTKHKNLPTSASNICDIASTSSLGWVAPSHAEFRRVFCMWICLHIEIRSIHKQHTIYNVIYIYIYISYYIILDYAMLYHIILYYAMLYYICGLGNMHRVPLHPH